MREDWSRELRSRSVHGKRVVRYIRKRKRTIFVGLLVLMAIGVIAGGLIEVSGKPGPYTSSIDLSYVDRINPIAGDSNNLGSQILNLIYHPQGLSRVALTNRITSMVDAAHSYLKSASDIVPPYPWGESNEPCTHSLTDRYKAVSLFTKGVYGLLGGLYGNSPQSASWTLEQLGRARSLVHSSDRLWRDCASQLSRAPGHPRLQSSVWSTLQVVTFLPVASQPITGSGHSITSGNPSHLGISAPVSHPLTGTGQTVSGSGTNSTGTAAPTGSAGTTSTTATPGTIGTTGTKSANGSGTTHPAGGIYSHVSVRRSVQVIRWSSAGLNAFVAALAADSSLAADPSLVISNYSIDPAPLPPSSPGMIDIPPSSSVNLEVVVANKGNTPIPGVRVGGSMTCISCHSNKIISMTVDRAYSPGNVYLDPSGSSGIIFNVLHVSSSGTYRVSIDAVSALSAVSASLQFTLVVGT